MKSLEIQFAYSQQNIPQHNGLVFLSDFLNTYFTKRSSFVDSMLSDRQQQSQRYVATMAIIKKQKQKKKSKRKSPLQFTTVASFLACKYLKTSVFLWKDLNILFMATEYKFSAHYNCIKLCFIFYESTPGKQTYNVDLMSGTLIYLLRFLFSFTPQVKGQKLQVFCNHCFSNLNISFSNQGKKK